MILYDVKVVRQRPERLEHGRLCLLQIGTLHGEAFAVDVLQLGQKAFEPPGLTLYISYVELCIRVIILDDIITMSVITYIYIYKS